MLELHFLKSNHKCCLFQQYQRHQGIQIVNRTGSENWATEIAEKLHAYGGFSRFRSCATTFTLLKKYGRARTYVQLGENSGSGAALRIEIALRAGNSEEALAEANTAARTDGARYVDVIRACLGSAPKEELRKAEAENEADPQLAQDSEGRYRYASVLGYCGEPDEAIRQLGKAIQGNYCSYPARRAIQFLKAFAGDQSSRS